MSAGIIEMIFSFGVILALAIWQLWSVWDPTKKDSEPDENDQADP